MKKFMAVILFAWKERRVISFIWFFLIILSYIFFKQFYDVKDELQNNWSKIYDPLVTVVSFSLPIFLGSYFLGKEWRDSLEKRLTVHFKLKDKYVMSCYEAYLSSESDIRTWGQQIGQQMNKGTQLSFYPYMKQDAPVTLYDYNEKKKTFYRLYVLTIYLRFKEDGQYEYTINKEDPKFSENEYLIWFDNNHETPGNEKILYSDKIDGVPPDLEKVKLYHALEKQKPKDEKTVSS